MAKRYEYLRGRLRQIGLEERDLAYSLGITPQALSHRFSGRTEWRQGEMYRTLDVCRAQPEELHLFFPMNGIGAAAPAAAAKEEINLGGDAAKYLSGFIRCVMEGARA